MLVDWRRRPFSAEISRGAAESAIWTALAHLGPSRVASTWIGMAGEFEHRMTMRFPYELLDRGVLFGIKERRGDPGLSEVALQDGSRGFRAHLLGVQDVGGPAASKRYKRGAARTLWTQPTIPYGDTSQRSSPSSTSITGVVLRSPLLRPVVVRR